MEAKHKKFLEAFLKETLFNFEDIAKSLVEAKIISKETIDDILYHEPNQNNEDPHIRNIELIKAVENSQSPNVFEKLEKVLKEIPLLGNEEPTLNMLDQPIQKNVPPEKRGFSGIIRKFEHIFSSTKPNKHCLGLDSGTSVQSISFGSSWGEPVISFQYYEDARSGNSETSSLNQTHICNPSHVSSSSESDSSSDSIPFHIDMNVTMAIVLNSGTKQMKIQESKEFHNHTTQDCYKMTSNPRGPCLIINNIDFEGDIFPTRKGSDQDAQRFDTIFKQLGFKVIMTRNQTADQMRQTFKQVARKCRPEHDSLFVFIFSHGSEHGIYGTDGMEVDLENEIFACFDNHNCKAMIGKPKVFVIQACRGRSRDCGGDGDALDSVAWTSVTGSPSAASDSNTHTTLVSATTTSGCLQAQRTKTNLNRVPEDWLPDTKPTGNQQKKRKHPIRTDMLIVFSCLAGFVSVRNELAGSWLGVALAYFILEHAHEHNLMRILNLVTSDVIQRESSHGHIQAVEVRLLGWTKNLYFNPGITDETLKNLGHIRQSCNDSG